MRRFGLDGGLFACAGDTLLHMAQRHNRSIEFVATLLQLGADKKIVNNCGIAAEDVNPHMIQQAEELMEQWRARHRELWDYM